MVTQRWGDGQRWAVGIALAVALAALLCIGAGLGAAPLFSPAGNALRERPMGETPQAKIEAYMRSIHRGDRAVALAAWEPGPPQQTYYNALSLRREQVTDELLALGIREYSILQYEWWTTCCEPHMTCSARDAGGARGRVQVLDRQGNPLSYTFDVFAREQPYWSDAMGNPVRHWVVVRDVYALGEEPLYWRWVHETDVRYLS